MTGSYENIVKISVEYDKDLEIIYHNGKVFMDVSRMEPIQNTLKYEEATSLAEPASIEEEESSNGGRFPPGSYMFYYCLIVAVLLTLGAGVMSGLTVGYLSIDQLELEMKLQNGTEEEKKNALAVLPVLEDHHYLLVTLLLANALCMEALPIYLDSIVPSAYAILISVIAVLFFGEVIPQAICTGPQQIKIGAFLAPLIQILKIALGIISYPIAKILDCILGEHMATRYSNNDLKALIELHSYHALEAMDHEQNWKAENRGLKPYQTKMIKSVLDTKDGFVDKLMVPDNKIFKVNINKNINNKLAKKLTDAGYSRIPVYDGDDKNRIVGILLIKQLIGLDLTEDRKISDLVKEGEVVLRKPLFISPKEKFEGLLNHFTKGRSHMAIITDDPIKMDKYAQGLEENANERSLGEGSKDDTMKSDIKPAKVLGLLTLEDLIEYIIKEDILDEADYDKDLMQNKNPNIMVNNRNWHQNSNNLSQLFIENRSKIHDFVHSHLKESFEDHKKFKFRKNLAQSITIDKKDLTHSLLDKESSVMDNPIKEREDNKEDQA
eukprot:CAMPEP_0196996352 /NCGR_PEP_ID=MMETSP1380-20130617/2254_1 /TAXON_ID=5936 /ORGANISM="Euplotes crassus, Strain CT5" /LENGTH=550 /DNA_ID=CAMNT_0042412287 /DNA_START=71 /DNA_END=1723 /DNA_ORIENTATION=+